jgi:pyrroline-5-carboxylate reductase
MKREAIGFIGAGNMAGAMIKGIIESRCYGHEDIYISDKRREAVEELVLRHRVKGCRDNNELMAICRTVVLAVKPQNMKEMLAGIRGDVTGEHFLISIAAGIPLDMIRSAIEKRAFLARAMPNTPALVQSGITAICFGEGVGEELIEKAKRIFDSVGRSVVLPESLIDAVTALSGSGPGYIFRLMEAMTQAGVEVGLDKGTSRLLVIETFMGAARLAMISERPLSELREMVTSPGGTTAAGLAVMEEADVAGIIRRTIRVAAERAKEIGDTYR